MSLFRNHYNIPLIHAEAKDMFLGRLKGVSDPEQKRKIIGAAFIDVFDKESHKVGGAEFLAQGHALYPDVIESVTGHRRALSHHQESSAMSAACPNA